VLYSLKGITDARVARLYYDASKISIKHRDQARASLFARHMNRDSPWKGRIVRTLRKSGNNQRNRPRRILMPLTSTDGYGELGDSLGFGSNTRRRWAVFSAYAIQGICLAWCQSSGIAGAINHERPRLPSLLSTAAQHMPCLSRRALAGLVSEALASLVNY
jgi:hypothetical protein